MTSHPRIDYQSNPVRKLSGELIMPGDKSISHRAIILGSIADGKTTISGLLDSEDARATINVFKDLGVEIESNDGLVEITGRGLVGLQASHKPLYFGNSGTSVRLLSGVLAGQNFDSTLTGDDSLSKRPMQRIIDPLKEMGAVIESSENGTLPIQITGGNTLTGIRYILPVASAQLKSCLLLAGLNAMGKTVISEPAMTRDHTERMLSKFGASIIFENGVVEINPGPLRARHIKVPGDISSAAFFIIAGCICPGSDILLKEVGINPTRSAIIEIMRLMGGEIQIIPRAETDTEPVADIRIKHARLKGIKIPSHLVPVAIDEFPAIMVAAAYADGETVLSNAGELRVKESDRIEAIAEGLNGLGIKVETQTDGMRVMGGSVQGGEINSFGDHRIAMAFAIAGTNATSPVKIIDCINVNTSFPGFIEAACSLGCDIESRTIDA